ncbi:MAG: PAS domain S-box protein [Syntrophobacteraceae bacterium]|nr:PAS domain S-box protein [Syntrophobacteraceae bacterium]
MNENPRNSSEIAPVTPSRAFSSIRGRLFLLLLFVLIPVMVGQGVYLYVRYQVRLINASRRNEQMSQAAAAALVGFIMDVVHQETAMGANFTMAAPVSPQEMQRILAVNKAAFPAVRDFAWSDPQGRVVMSSLRSVVGLDLSDRKYIRKLRSGRSWMVSDLLRSRATGKPIFTVSLAVRSGRGELLGIVMAAIDPEGLKNSIGIDPAGDEAVTILDSQGKPVFRLTGGEARRWRPNSSQNQSFAEAKDRLRATVPVSSFGWTACASSSEKSVVAPVQSQLLRESLLFFLVAVAAFLAAFTLSEGISGSIRKLLDHALALGEGEVERDLEVRGPAELKGLASALNAMAQNIRARESALKIAQKRLIAVFETIPACVYLQARDRSIVFANRTFRETFGDPEALSCHDLFMAGTEPCGNCDMPHTIHAPIPRDWEWTAPDGKFYSIHTHPFTDTDGAPLVLKLAVDISRRKTAEEALKQSGEQFRSLAAELDTIFNSVPATIWYKDTGNNFIRVNKAAADFAGVNPEEIQGRPVAQFFPLDAEAYYRDDLEVLSSGQSKLGIIERAISLSGAEKWVRTDKLPIRDALGKITGILAVSMDVTDLRQTQLALGQSESRLRFLSSQLLSAHEEERKRIARDLHDSVGSSLTAIKMGIENTRAELKQSGSSPRMLDSLIEWTQLTIDEIRRLMSDLRPPVLDDMGVVAALDWFLRQYRTIYPRIHVEARITIDERDIPEPLRIVIFRITQEALHNIARHSGAEYVEISLVKQEGAIRFSIEDNGEGFDLAAVRDRRGVGLGSMKERAELSGGSFSIRSDPGTGTILSAEWPLLMP